MTKNTYKIKFSFTGFNYNSGKKENYSRWTTIRAENEQEAKNNFQKQISIKSECKGWENIVITSIEHLTRKDQ